MKFFLVLFPPAICYTGGTPKIAMERKMEQGFHSGGGNTMYNSIKILTLPYGHKQVLLVPLKNSTRNDAIKID